MRVSLGPVFFLGSIHPANHWDFPDATKPRNQFPPTYCYKHCFFLVKRVPQNKKKSDVNMYIYIYIPGTQMTLVLIGKGLVLGG